MISLTSLVPSWQTGSGCASLKESKTNSPIPHIAITKFESPHTWVMDEWWKWALDAGNAYVLTSCPLRNEKCCTSERESSLAADPTSVLPRNMESLWEKIEWQLIPGLVIFSPTPDWRRKSKTLIVSRVQNTPSFPSASDELTLHINK